MNPVTPPGNTPTLNTERLVLRPLSAHEAPALQRISNEPPVRRYLWDDEPVTSAQIDDVVVQSMRMFSEEGVGLMKAVGEIAPGQPGVPYFSLNRDEFLASEASQA